MLKYTNKIFNNIYVLEKSIKIYFLGIFIKVKFFENRMRL